MFLAAATGGWRAEIQYRRFCVTLYIYIVQSLYVYMHVHNVMYIQYVHVDANTIHVQMYVQMSRYTKVYVL